MMRRKIILVLGSILLGISLAKAQGVAPKAEIVNPQPVDAHVGGSSLIAPGPIEKNLSDDELVNSGQISIKTAYKNKIVYTMDRVRDLTPLMEDCQKRGGIFKECGSVCDDTNGPVTCVAVCANTCDNIPSKE